MNQRCAIKVLECHGASVAIIAWMDPTTCCYGEQLWRRCVARKSRICALSGQIHPPRLVRSPPRNISADLRDVASLRRMIWFAMRGQNDENYSSRGAPYGQL
ncbi:DUF3331 domain-containing protein [Paraburkholderia madseniana]|uniref:DUF3331 domain-containing protein n=1 Tax=Paraburkholderia madseniana TaxID=2599607 RepID=UPI0038B8C987